jgi:hypothetical protein
LIVRPSQGHRLATPMAARKSQLGRLGMGRILSPASAWR